ncbi:MAG: ABC transporter permease [Alphaproteobacteria bacterium]|nr:ABC transporter permease [Alphaproteobacteria bacterium]
MSIRYFLERLGWAAFVLFGSSVVIFVILHVIPGDPARAMLGPEGTPEAVAKLREQLGLDDPLTHQYLLWLGRAIRGDLGRSILLSQSVGSLLGERLPITLLLGLYALGFAVLLAIPVSVVSATRRGTLVDYGGRFLALIGLAMPSFWLGLMLVLLFGVVLQWLPVFGYVSPRQSVADHVRHMVLPAVALGSAYAAMIMETTRNSLIEVLHQDHVRTARAGGLTETLVLYKYAMRNALIPTITVIGIQIGYLMSGALVVESVFAIPGMGRLLVNAVLSRDYPLVQGAMLVTVLVFSLTNLCVDLLYAVIDPRVGKA